MSQKPIFSFLKDDPELPLELRALVGRDGAGGDVLGLDFTFTFMSVAFNGRFESGQGGGTLTLSATLGPLPFSAESPAARAALLAIVDAAGRHLGAFHIAPGGKIALASRIPMTAPVSADALIAAIVAALVRWKPYFTVIFAYLVPPDETAPGTSRVRSSWRRGAVAASPRRLRGARPS